MMVRRKGSRVSPKYSLFARARVTPLDVSQFVEEEEQQGLNLAESIGQSLPGSREQPIRVIHEGLDMA
jgi:hypothetical protein